ncbi:uncharacterized protein [Euwallacea fornicatus]|uniref:uncharacterized protein n=1 Tax=Euwallacea fornicatus TaxID=995702 RepID=UPI00338E11C1
MCIKTFFLLCAVVYATKAFPNYILGMDNASANVLTRLGLSFRDDIDYNAYILNLEDVIEDVQQVVLKVIQNAVALGTEFVNAAAIYLSQQSVWKITNLQSSMFKDFESERHNAFTQDIDISSCVSEAITLVYNASQDSIAKLQEKLDNITTNFNDFTSETYTAPADTTLTKSYTIRDRIYKCPFNSTDFVPFYLCLTVQAVLEDIVSLNEFAEKFNDTSAQITELVAEFKESASLYGDLYVDNFNVTSQKIFEDVFLPCAKDIGYTP